MSKYGVWIYGEIEADNLQEANEKAMELRIDDPLRIDLVEEV